VYHRSGRVDHRMLAYSWRAACGLSPARVLRAQGLLRLWGVAKLREPNSLLGMAWELGEEYKVRLGGGCINNAVDEVVRKYGGDVEWPEPGLRKEWKEAIAAVSEGVRCCGGTPGPPLGPPAGGHTEQEVATSALCECGSGAPQMRAPRGPCLCSNPPGKKIAKAGSARTLLM
jgi:hypothetical protein